jgi:hypothetical protein
MVTPTMFPVDKKAYRSGGARQKVQLKVLF